MTPVVVGVDGSEPAATAAVWAAREAALRRCPLHVVYACDWPLLGTSMRTAPMVSARAEADDAVDAAVRRVRATIPGLAVRGEVRTGRPGPLLAEASRHAELLVVGSHGRGWVGGLVLGTTSRYLARHVVCPLIVMPPHAVDATAAGPVVVGTDGRPDSDAAVAFALREADLRRVPVLAIQAGRAPRDTAVDAASAAAEEDRLLAESLSALSAGHPDVVLRRRVVHRPAARTLVDAVHGADLLVVGAGKAGLRGLLGTVGAQVLHDCPTAVALVRREP
ncbi:MAG TPA: universal stress protein [Actinocatenispora sp.]